MHFDVFFFFLMPRYCQQYFTILLIVIMSSYRCCDTAVVAVMGVAHNSHPKVAEYPFTTINPHLGVVEFPDHYRYTVADIPGLIVGASENVGLGHSFLRHIERSRVLLYIIDMSLENGAMYGRFFFFWFFLFFRH